MPEEEYGWLPREKLLSFEEISELAGIFTEVGIEKVRLTGGEPLLRKDLPVLVRMLAQNPRIRDLALTTNGVLLAGQAQALWDAGLHRLTVSLDTLRPDRFLVLTRRDAHAPVLRGIEAARQAGFRALKIDAVVVRGVNDDELADLIEFGKRADAEVRFIEYMDVGGATQWSRSKVVSRAEILGALSRRYGRIEPVVEDSSAPAERFLLADGTVFGIIASTTTPFCRRCDRSRLTADGIWYLCLYAQKGTDLRKSLRSAATREEIKSLIVSQWTKRTDRGAEERKDLPSRGVLVGIQQLRQDPHLEMHTRGRLGATLLRATAHRSPSTRVLAAARSAGHRAFFRNLCNRRERPVSNNTDPKREHDYEIVLKPPEVASFSPENKHTRRWRMAQ
jgi:cyclic pyranopterin phosphate synthase